MDETIETLYVVDPNNPTGYAQVLEEGTDANGDGRLQAAEIEKSFTLGQDVISQQAPAIASAATLYLLYDGHGSTRAVVDSAALVRERYAYDAYGNMLPGVGLTVDPATALTSLLYSGEQTDPTGLQYLRARYYNPASGRFNRLDPYTGNLQDPLSLHKYLYTQGNPIMLSDPTGMFGLAGLAAGISMATSIRSIKIETDLFIFDAAVATINGITNGSTSSEIFLDFLFNEAVGFGSGFALGRVIQGAATRLDGSARALRRTAAQRVNLADELVSAKRLQGLQARSSKSHFVDRHGPGTTIEQQYNRSVDGRIPGEKGGFGRPGNSSRFFTNRQMEGAYDQAVVLHRQRGGGTLPVDFEMDEFVGEGFTEGGRQYVITGNVRAFFDRAGNMISMFPLLSKL